MKTTLESHYYLVAVNSPFNGSLLTYKSMDEMPSQLKRGQLVKVPLENTKRGMYIVTVLFSDGLRISKKIMVEESE